VWLEQGFGFLVLWLVHLLGMNLLGSVERAAVDAGDIGMGGDAASIQFSVQKRFALYRLLLRVATLSMMAALAVWLVFAQM
jgi:hypothetical protein